MAPSVLYSSSIPNVPEDQSVVRIETETGLASKNMYEPVKPISFVDVTHVEESGSSSEPSPVDGSVKPLVTAQPNPPIQLDHVVSGLPEPMSGAKKLRKMLLETDELIVCPGVYDGLSARTAIELGFNAMYMVCFLCLLHRFPGSIRDVADYLSIDWCRNNGISSRTARLSYRAAP